MSVSKSQIIDDKFGNLIISGTITSSYPNDVFENVFRLDPIKGFKKYDLGEHDGYATVSEIGFSPTNEPVSEGFKKTYEKNRWRRGTRIDFNFPTSYTSGVKKPLRIQPNYGIDKDDSYFLNNIHYNKVNFNTSSLGNYSGSHRFPQIILNSNSGSLISSSHSNKFDFNGNDDFSISFWIKPRPVINIAKGINYAAISGSNDKQNTFTVGVGNFNFKKKKFAF